MKVKKIATAACGVVAAVALAGVLAACGTGGQTAADGETVTITALDASGAETQIEVPKNPQRVAILDFAALDIIDALGCGDSVVGCASTTLDYLEKYTEDENVAALGTIKEADMEAVANCEPDVIFIGGRLSSSYDALSEIAPVVYLSADITGKGLVESTKDTAATIAQIFDVEDTVSSKFDDFEQRIAALQEVSAGKTAVVGMATSGSFNITGNDGRCSLIGNEVGFENLAAGDSTSTHGNEASFETVVDMDPDYIFVLDRDAAIGTDGAQLAADVMDNELIDSTRAVQDGHLVIMAHPAAWYTAEGGVTALDLMISDLEEALP